MISDFETNENHDNMQSASADHTARRIMVISAPSGAGKTSIAHRLLASHPEWSFSTSATTRLQRPHETDGIDYFFLNDEEFLSMVASGDMIEWEEIFGAKYGTMRGEVKRLLDDPAVERVIFDVDVKGALSIKRAFPDEAILLFIAPPSMEELERRLRMRHTESEENILRRLNRASMEMATSDSFDIIVVNDDLDRAVDEIERLLSMK